MGVGCDSPLGYVDNSLSWLPPEFTSLNKNNVSVKDEISDEHLFITLLKIRRE